MCLWLHVWEYTYMLSEETGDADFEISELMLFVELFTVSLVSQ